MAGFSLHGDVRLILIIMIDLLTGGNSVQTINSFSHFDIRPLILFCVRGRTLNSSYSIFKVPGFFAVPIISHNGQNCQGIHRFSERNVPCNLIYF